MPNQPAKDNDGFEHEDLSPGGVFYFMAGLGVVVVVIYFILLGMYHVLDTYQRAHQPPVSPMVTAPVDTRAVSHEDTQAFPQPRLEESERARNFGSSSRTKIASSPPTTGWIKTKGLCRFLSTAPWI